MDFLWCQLFEDAACSFHLSLLHGRISSCIWSIVEMACIFISHWINGCLGGSCSEVGSQRPSSHTVLPIFLHEDAGFILTNWQKTNGDWLISPTQGWSMSDSDRKQCCKLALAFWYALNKSLSASAWRKWAQDGLLYGSYHSSPFLLFPLSFLLIVLVWPFFFFFQIANLQIVTRKFIINYESLAFS